MIRIFLAGWILELGIEKESLEKWVPGQCGHLQIPRLRNDWNVWHLPSSSLREDNLLQNVVVNFSENDKSHFLLRA